MGDGFGNVCQSDGATWGHGVTTDVAANTCFDFCGLHHYASFNASSIDNRPWDAWFGDPSLVVSTSVNVHAYSAPDYSEGWGHLCPVLRDVKSRWTIEYCIEEWRSNYPHALGPPTCGTGSGNNEQIITSLPSGSGTKNWASVGAGSSTTFDIPQQQQQPSGWKQITATIQASQLKNALSQIYATCAGAPLSSDPRDYQLIGVEQGIEVGGTSFAAGEATQNLQLSTAYTFSNAPANTALPSVPGKPTVGKAIVAKPGSWSAPATYAYRWSRCDGAGANCTAISGATASTYTPVASDAGARLTVTVAAGGAVSGTTNLAWSAPVTSAPSAPVKASRTQV